MKNTVILTTLFVLVVSAWALERSSPVSFTLGPVPATVDLRNMVRSHLVQRACVCLEKSEQDRLQAFLDHDWRTWRARIRKSVQKEIGESVLAAKGAPLHVRPVSRYETSLCDIENVLFASLPGWDVNASVFLPKKNIFPPPWPAVVIPVGHSSKTRANYQIPAQIFSSLGYAAVLFDPPGMAGEKQGGNDHFTDGVRCYLTGTSANLYFVMDALRCLDYLQSRPDIDSRHGIAMTGVSGGGSTTMYCMLLDDRITAAGPACCALPSIQHPVLDAYAPCTETLPYARFKDGVDDISLLCAAIPTPLLLMYGEKDEVFKLAYSDEIARQTASAYQTAGVAERFNRYADTSGHAYTMTMAVKFTEWMDRWVRKTPGRVLAKLNPEQFKMLPDSVLFCHPDLDGNMYTLNRQLALDLQQHHTGKDLRQAVKTVLGLEQAVAMPLCRAGQPTQVWAHYLQELMLTPEPGIELPSTLLYPLQQQPRSGAVLFFDDRGRWTELRQQKVLADLAHFLQTESRQASVLTVDVRGWGDSEAADLPYEIAAWGHSSRWISYVSAALGDPILAMRIRDGLSALAYLRARPEIDPAKIVVGGYGMGGVLAQHIAVLEEELAGVFTIQAPATLLCLAEAKTYAWSQEAFLPNVLIYYDLPELYSVLKMPALAVNPLDAEKKMLRESALEVFSAAKKMNPQFSIVQTDRVALTLKTWVERIIY